METTLTANSLGQIAQVLQRGPRAIATAAQSLGLRPVIVLDGVAHYDDQAIEVLRAHFNEPLKTKRYSPEGKP